MKRTSIRHTFVSAFFISLFSYFPVAVADSPEGFWVATESRVFRFHPDTLETESSISAAGIESIAVDSVNGDLWVATSSGIQVFSAQGYFARQIELDEEPGSIDELFINGSSGTYWIRRGTRQQLFTFTGEQILEFELPPHAEIDFNREAEVLLLREGENLSFIDGAGRTVARAVEQGLESITAIDNGWAGINAGALYSLELSGEELILHEVRAEAPGTDGRVVGGDRSAVWVASGSKLSRIALDAGYSLEDLPVGFDVSNRDILIDPRRVAAFTVADAGIARIDQNGVVENKPGELENGIIDVALHTDNTKPEIDIDTPAEKWETNNSIVNISTTAVDIGSGVDSGTVSIRSNGADLSHDCTPSDETGSALVCTASADLPDGQHLLSASVKDIAGNQSETDERLFTVDTVAPRIELIWPPANLVTNQKTIPVHGTLTEFASVTVADEAITVSPGNEFFSEVGLVEGENSIDVLARDPAGNTTELVVNPELDTVPPTLVIDSPSSVTTTSSAEIMVRGKAEDAVSVRVNGHEESLAASGSFSRRVSLNRGLNTVEVAASDEAGNAATEILEITYLSDAHPGQGNQGLHVSGGGNGSNYTVSAPPGAFSPGTEIEFIVEGANGVSDRITVTVDQNGSLSADIEVPEGSTLSYSVTAGTGEQGGYTQLQLPGENGNTPSTGRDNSPKRDTGNDLNTMMFTPPDQEGKAVGAVSGEFSVDPTGTANFKIPIHVSAGAAGIQPDLAFMYSSRAGDGHLGLGWSVSGLSSIERCPQNKAVHGQFRTVQYDQDDRFCLNGQPLILESGTYGADGSTYRTDVNNFEKISASGGTTGNGSDTFTIKGKDGLIRTYGSVSGFSSDGKIMLGSTGKVRTWAISKIEDLNGNYIRFTYGRHSSNDEYWAANIYWYNRNGTNLGRVQFLYTTRTDKTTQYVHGGHPIRNRRLLTSVKLYARQDASHLASGSTVGTNSNHYATYNLNYVTLSDASQGPNRLKTIELCDNAGLCMPATGFSQTQKPWEYNQQDNNYFFDLYNHSAKFLDVQGDGKLDAIFHYGGTVRFKPSLGSVKNTSITVNSARFDRIVYGDLNDDGYVDLLVPDSGSGLTAYRIHYWDPVAKNFESTGNDSISSFVDELDQLPLIVDLDRDHLPEIITHSNGAYDYRTLKFYKRTSASDPYSIVSMPEIYQVSTDQPIHVIEYDGDGYPDIFVEQYKGYCAGPYYDPDFGGYDTIFYPQMTTCGNTAGVLKNEDGQLYNHDNLSLKDVKVADLNGDGLTDIVHYDSPNNRWRVLQNQYMSYVQTSIGPSMSLTHGQFDKSRLIDFEPNGRIDLAVIDGGNATVYMGHGDRFGPITYQMPYSSSKAWVVADFNGDGNMDIIQNNTSVGGVDHWVVKYQEGDMPGLLKTVRDGFGKKTWIDYAPLMSGGNGTDPVYMGHVHDSAERDPNEPADTRDFQGQLYVVTGYAVDAGVNDASGNELQLYTSYRYKGAKTQRDGRGFLGFREIWSTNHNTGMINLNRHRQGYPHTGQVSFSEQIVFDQQIINPDLLDIKLAFHDDCVDDVTGCDLHIEMPDETAPTYSQIRSQVGGTTVKKTVTEYATLHNASFTTKNIEEHFKYHDGTAVRTIVSDFTSSGNPAYSSDGELLYALTTTTGDGTSYTKEVNNTYAACQDWSRLSETTVEHDFSAGDPDVTDGTSNGHVVTRKSTFSYKSSNCQLEETVTEPTNTKGVTTTYGYDTFGNKTSTTVESNAGGDGRTSSKTYDNSARFVISQTNAVGHTETIRWDANYSSKTKHIGPNQLPATTWSYDTFGNLTSTTSPTGLTDTQSLSWCDSSCGSYPGAVYFSTSVQDLPNNESITVKTYYDRRGRELGGTRTDVDGVYDQAIVYSSRGRKIAASALAKTSSTLRCWTYIEYDEHGRNRAELTPASSSACSSRTSGVPDEAAIRSFYNSPPSGYAVNRTIHDGLTTYYQDAEGRTTSKVKYPNGWLKSFREHGITGSVDPGSPPAILQIDSNSMVTTYTYDAQGNMTGVADPAGNVSAMYFDIFGRKTGMDDPDMGLWSYVNNAFGELESQTDAENQTISMTYDDLGRMETRTDAGGTTTWVYDTAAKGKGKLASVKGPGYYDVYKYDSYGRVERKGMVRDNHAWWQEWQYDAASRITRINYPALTTGSPDASGEVSATAGSVGSYYVTYQYSLDRIQSVKDPTGTDLWTHGSLDVAGRLQSFNLGNGISELHGRDQATGELGHISVGPSANGSVVDYDYTWDDAGNLVSRTDNVWGVVESFGYDALYRMTSHTIDTPDDSVLTAPVTQTNDYDAIGNLQKKAGNSNYQYTGYGPHAVSSVKVGSTTYNDYVYDANGNLTSGGGRSVTWTAFNKPKKIQKASDNYSEFFYGPDRSRYRHDQKHPTRGLLKFYEVNADFQHIRYASTARQRYHIRIGGQVIAVKEFNTSLDGSTTNSEALNFLHRDHLGSVTAITKADGSTLQQLDYGPWGKRRDLSTLTISPAFAWNSSWTTPPGWTDFHRGFTGHEMLDELGLVHMNGRIYDPEIGRFLSADPFVQFPESTQGYNRYSYVGNNPLSYTDPSGYFSWSKFRDKWVKPIVAIAASIATYGAVSGYLATTYTAQVGLISVTVKTVGVGAQIAASMAAGAVGGAIASGTPEGAARGAAAGFFAGAGQVALGAIGTGSGTFLQRTVVSGASGCAAGAAAGGSCSRGMKLAVAADWAYLASQALTNTEPTWETATDEAVVKPNPELQEEFAALNGGDCPLKCDVVSETASNVGSAVQVGPADRLLVGQPVSKVLQQHGNRLFPNGLSAGTEGSAFMQGLGRNVPGFQSNAIFHDRLMGAFQRMTGMEGAAFNIINAASIAPAFAFHYGGLGLYSYRYYYDELAEGKY